MAELIIIRGLPGSGKTTYAKEYFPDRLIYEPDHLFEDLSGRYRFEPQLFEDAHTFCQWLVDAALARKEKVVICDVFPTHESYFPYVQLADYHKVEYGLIVCKEQFSNLHHVPEFVYNRMKEIWEE